MPYLLVSLILPALLTWLLGDVLSMSDEDRFLLFVALFVAIFVGSIAVAQLMEHGQRHRRNQEVQGIKPLHALKETLAKHQLAVICAAVLVAGSLSWYPRGSATAPAPQTSVAPTAALAPQTKASQIPTLADRPSQELAAAQDAVHAWALAWSLRNLDEYLAAYSKDFVPADNVPRKKWEQVRRQRVGGADYIEVKVLDLVVDPLGKDLVKAVFIQKYHARGKDDLSRKTLVLKKEGTAWKIQSEQAVPLKG